MRFQKMKLSFLFVCIVILLVACSEPNDITSGNGINSDNLEDSSISAETSTPTPTIVPTPTPPPPKSLGISVVEIVSLINEVIENKPSYWQDVYLYRSFLLDDMKIDDYHLGGKNRPILHMFVCTDYASDFVTSVLFNANGIGDAQKEFVYSCYNAIVDAISSEILSYATIKIIDDELQKMAWGVEFPDLLVISLDFKTEDEFRQITKLKPAQDFFESEERQEQIENLIASFSYDEIITMVNDYITVYNPDEFDSAYSVLGILSDAELAFEYRDKWIIDYDDFNNSYSLSFEGARTISQICGISVRMSSSSEILRAGFVKPDWLFFDEIEIKADGVSVYKSTFDYFSVKRDMLSGGNIAEYVELKGSISTDDRIAIYESDRTVIRFRNTDDKTAYDYTLTNDEKNALYFSRLLREANSSILSLIEGLQIHYSYWTFS